MTLAPRFLVSLWARLQAARFKHRLRAAGDGVSAQRAIFRHLLARMATTELGKRQGLGSAMDYESFRQTQPLVEYRHYKPFIERMAAGEANVLWPGRCRHFVETAGTTTGSPRRLPMTAELLAHYREGIFAAVMSHAARVGHVKSFFGRHLHAGNSTALHRKDGAATGSFDAFIHLALSPWVVANLYTPAPAVARLPEGMDKAVLAATTVIKQDVTLIAGTPANLRTFGVAARAGASHGLPKLVELSAPWPNLECVLHYGTSLGLLTEELRALFGTRVDYHEVYAAAEGWFAVQDGESSAGLRLLTNAGIFYEFLPLREYHDDLPPSLGSRCVPLEQVKAGEDYVLVITTPSGLCRYVVGDIVRIVSTAPVRLRVVGRTKLQLSAKGERVTERELTDALVEVCRSNDWIPVNFHVAPLSQGPSLPRFAHEWWIELKPGTVKTPTGPFLGAELDLALARRNRDYGARRAARELDAPVVRLVMPGVFDQWAREAKPRTGANRLPACRPDRLIADQLAALTRFYSPTQAPFVSARD